MMNLDKTYVYIHTKKVSIYQKKLSSKYKNRILRKIALQALKTEKTKKEYKSIDILNVIYRMHLFLHGYATMFR